MSIVVTGVAGFIGFHLTGALLSRGETVIGIDNVNDYYDPALKRGRLESLGHHGGGFHFHEGSIADPSVWQRLRQDDAKPASIIHLAAQAGVRYSIENPQAYVDANLKGHSTVLEYARHNGVEHLVYASSSSVYGANKKVPFSETDVTESPESFYGATKKSNELLSSSYAKLYGIPQTGLRFFTVYGPWGRPDMAYFIFAEKMRRGEPIQLFNQGKMARDFTYIDDIVDGIIAAWQNPPGVVDDRPHQIYNLGNDQPEDLSKMVEALEKHLGMSAEKILAPMQPGDVVRTWADISKARTELKYAPKTSLDQGIKSFVEWYKDYIGPEGFVK